MRRVIELMRRGMPVSAVHHEGDEDRLHLLMLDLRIPAGAKLC